MNELMDDYLTQKGFRNVNTVTLGISEDDFVDLSSRQEKPYILYVGRIDGNKRPEWVLDAFLESDSEGFELQFIGAGPRQKFLERKVANSGRKDDIKLHGQIPREDVLQWMREATVFVLPSKFEVCPNVTIEAIASGCPVIAGNTMGNQELIDDKETGFLFDKNDRSDLFKILDNVLSTPTWRREVAHAAYEYTLENHTTSTIADEYLEIGCQVRS